MKVAATTRWRHQKLDVMDANAAGELPVTFIPLGIVGHPERTGWPPTEERGYASAEGRLGGHRSPL